MDNKEALYPATAKDISKDAVSEDVKEMNPGEAEEYYALPLGSKSILKSVLSIIFSLLSVGLSFLWYLGFAISVTGAVCALLFRKQFGYFNKAAVIGLIISIFGFVFSGFFLAASLIGLI